MDWDEIRQQLGFEYGPGSWFFVSDRHVYKKDTGHLFSRKETERPLILATPLGPDITLYPRSASGTSGFRHQPHHHDEDCRIDRDGRVVLGVPVTVDSSLLDETSFSCAEPEDTGLLGAIREALGVRRS